MSDTRRLLSPISATLLRAADYIDLHGWCQHNGETKDGAVCPHRAINLVSDTVTAAATYNFINGYLWRRYGVSSLERFSDMRDRTQAEVVSVMREAAMAKIVSD